MRVQPKSKGNCKEENLSAQHMVFDEADPKTVRQYVQEPLTKCISEAN
jgi:hypothetical protein